MILATLGSVVFLVCGETIAIEKVQAGVGAAGQENVTVLLRDGRIAAIGRDVAIPAGAERIDGTGLTLLPGFIDGCADHGFGKPEERVSAPSLLNEGVAQDYGIAAYAETAEASRRGLRPELRARSLLVAPDKEAAELNGKLRMAGFTAVLAAPSDGFLPGQPCLLELAELPARDAVVAEPGLLLLKFRSGSGGGGGGGGRRRAEGDYGYPSTLMGALAHLRQAFLDAQRLRAWRDAWRRNPAAIARPPDDSSLETLLAALDGELRVAFMVDRRNDLLRALDFAEEFRLKPVIVGGKEAWKVSERLAAARVPVIASLDFPDAPERKNAKVRGEEPKEEKTEAPPAADIAATPDKPEAPQTRTPTVAAATSETPAGPVQWDVADPVIAEPLELFEQRKRDWQDEVENVERLLAAGVEVALTTRGSDDVGDFLGDLRVAIEHGLDANAAIDCLTRAPATIFGVERQLGSLTPGASANLTLVSGDLASKDRAVRHVFVAGRHYSAPKAAPKPKGDGKESAKDSGKERKRDWKKDAASKDAAEGAAKPAEAAPSLDLTGTWTLTSKTGNAFKATLTLAQKEGALTGKLESEMGAADVTSGALAGTALTLTTAFQLQDRTFEFKLAGTAAADRITGTLDTPFGEPSEFEATRAIAPASRDGGDERDFLTEADRKPALRTGGDLFIRGATLLPVTQPGIAKGDLLVRDGKIAAIGPELAAPEGVAVLDGSGLFVMPGMVDCHSHAAIEGGVNEGTLSIVPEVRISDEIEPDDSTLWLALAGGTTTMNLLHGSANVVGGQNAVIKLRWGQPGAALLIEGAPRGVKFALGENPKQSNVGGGFDRSRRYPATRMGVEAALRRAFTRAADYREEWKDYAGARSRGEERLEPRRDLRLEALVDVMEGRILVHSHCYRADEILMLMRVAEEFGFRIKTLQHVLEGYKIAPEIAKHGAGPSTFSDWWAYKLEAYDAIPHNAALLTLAGARCSVNSDSAELTRRLYHEAAKTLRYGNLSEQDALAEVTIHPAWQLGIDDKVGSLEVGKDADLALFNGHPLSVYSRCEYTFVDGECMFERRYQDGETRPRNPTTAAFGPIDCPDPSQLPVPGQGGFYALVGGTIHPVSGPAIENGVLLIERGRIAAVGGADLRVPDHAEIVRCNGLQVYPGLFDAATTLGLGEIGSVAGSQDMKELGGIEPDLRVTASIHPASAHIPVTRCDGITTALVLPGGGTIPGRGSLIQLDGFTWEEMVLGDELVMRLQFPAVAGDETVEKALENEEIAKLDTLFSGALRYADARAAGIPGVPTAPGYDALLPFLRGADGKPPRTVIIDAAGANQIRVAVTFAEKHELNYLLLGCAEAWLVTDFLKQHGARCLVANSLGLPGGSQRYDAAYHNAGRLHAAGIPLAIVSLEQENVRQLGHHAGMAAAFGLPRDAALKAVTLAPAELLGVADRLGSLDPGKVANVIVTDGDPLELRTHVRYEFIAGKPIRLINKQTELYETYKARILGMPGVAAPPLGVNPTAGAGG